METKAVVYQTWDELVFENRNKEYGAYVLRKSYGDKVISGLFTSLAIFASLLFLSTLSGSGPVGSYLPPVTDDGFIFTQPPDFPKPEPKRIIQTKTTAVNDNAPPIVTPDIVEPAPDPTLEPSTSSDGLPGASTDQTGFVGDQVSLGTLVNVPVKEKVVNYAEVMPTYEGGNEEMMKFLTKKMRYPSAARRIQMEGTVFVSFIVNGDGSVSNVEVIRGFNPDCDKEAARVVSMLPGWLGGKQNGTPVGVRMILPIKFRIQ